VNAISKEEAERLQALRDHAWDYFEFHAEQRLKTFHFFIVLQTGLVAVMLFAARTGGLDMRVQVLLGMVMIFFSYVFRKLDDRTKGMIKVSEETLKLLERRLFGGAGDQELADAGPFANDPQIKGFVGRSFFGVVSYSKCFGAVFITFALLGVLIVIASK
jgi:hypothetical protein